MTITRTTTRLAAALALLMSAMAAEAVPVTVDFTVTSNDVSNPRGSEACWAAATSRSTMH